MQALENYDLLILSIEDLKKMKLEFPNVFIELMSKASSHFQGQILLKFE